MLNAIHVALIHFWIWANINPIDPYDTTGPLMSPVQIVELVVFGLVGGLILAVLFNRFGEWQEKRWKKEFDAQFAQQRKE